MDNEALVRELWKTNSFVAYWADCRRAWCACMRVLHSEQCGILHPRLKTWRPSSTPTLARTEEGAWGTR